MLKQENAILIKDLTTQIDGMIIHDNLNLTVKTGEILAIVGSSGAGKTTLLNCLLMLLTPEKGSITLLGKDLSSLSEPQKEQLRTQCGILFQGGALFNELTVLENILFPMQAHSKLLLENLLPLANLKLNMSGLAKDAGSKYPTELSGGMIKRAAMARSIALDPSLLFLDEPSAGLDPVSASDLDQLILNLRSSLKLTIVVVTHDLDTLQTVPDRIAFLGKGRVLACDTLTNLIKSQIPEVKSYFQNTRAKRTFGEN